MMYNILLVLNERRSLNVIHFIIDITAINLFYLFEYVLPVIADYGSALKLNDWAKFKDAYLRLFRFFLCSKSQGILTN